jgi:hypothetical protein
VPRRLPSCDAPTTQSTSDYSLAVLLEQRFDLKAERLISAREASFRKAARAAGSCSKVTLKMSSTCHRRSGGMAFARPIHDALGPH